MAFRVVTSGNMKKILVSVLAVIALSACTPSSPASTTPGGGVAGGNQTAVPTTPKESPSVTPTSSKSVDPVDPTTWVPADQQEVLKPAVRWIEVTSNYRSDDPYPGYDYDALDGLVGGELLTRLNGLKDRAANPTENDIAYWERDKAAGYHTSVAVFVDNVDQSGPDKWYVNMKTILSSSEGSGAPVFRTITVTRENGKFLAVSDARPQG